MNKTIALVVLLLTVLVGLLACRGRAAVFEIPEDYVGWVNVRYLDDSCSAPENGNVFRSVIRVGKDGIGCSSTWSGEGLNAVLYHYVNDDGERVRRLRSTGWGEGGEIWAQSGSSRGNIASFFVGSEKAFKETRTGALNHLRANRPDWLRP